MPGYSPQVLHYVPVWNQWCQTGTGTGTGIGTGATAYWGGDPWPAWSNATTTTLNASANLWQLWSNATVNPQMVWTGWVGDRTMRTAPYVQSPLTTPMPRLHSLARPDAAARTRARSLLEGVLSDEQKAELAKDGRFHVLGSRGRRYCIQTGRGQSGNVVLLDDQGEHQATLCAHPEGRLPDEDAFLAQMLCLETDEDEFLRTANVHAGRRPADMVLG